MIIACPCQMNHCQIHKNELQIIPNYDENANGTQCKLHLSYSNLNQCLDDRIYYLTNEASKLHQVFPSKCLQHFQHHGFGQFSKYNIPRTVIIESAAVPLENVFEILHNNGGFYSKHRN